MTKLSESSPESAIYYLSIISAITTCVYAICLAGAASPESIQMLGKLYEMILMLSCSSVGLTTLASALLFFTSHAYYVDKEEARKVLPALALSMLNIALHYWLLTKLQAGGIAS